VHPSPAGSDRATLREWLGLGVLGSVVAATSVDAFVLLLALPQIARALHASAAEQLWITDVYGFMLVGFMITAGTVADRVGHRRLLMAGGTVFAGASVCCAFATGPLMLIGARAVLGVAGATIAPAALGLVTTMFRDARQHTVALSVWQMCFMGGALLGPIAGGYLLEHFWWGSVFLIGPPTVGVLLITGPFTLPGDTRRAGGRVDPVSAPLFLGAILPIVYGIKEIASSGVRIEPAAALVLGCLAALAFVRRQRRLEHPLLDVSLFGNTAFAAITVVMVLITVISSLMFFTAQYLQLVVGMSTLQAAFAMLPAAAASVASIAATPFLVRRLQPATIIVGGMVIAGAGAWVFTTVGPGDCATPVLVGLAAATFGNSPVVGIGTTLILRSLPEDKAGAAAAIGQTGNEFGFASGVAVLGSVTALVYRVRLDLPAGLPRAVADRARTGLAQALQTGSPTAIRAARDAYVHGLHAVGWIVVAAAVAVALLSGIFLRGRPRSSARSHRPRWGRRRSV
jgi:DHA2 family multidrug resistance protein-like MFS transporter